MEKHWEKLLDLLKNEVLYVLQDIPKFKKGIKLYIKNVGQENVLTMLLNKILVMLVAMNC